jgi:hypothetical protein
LVEVDITIEYQSGKLNVVADVLSHKAQLVMMEVYGEPFLMPMKNRIHIWVDLQEKIEVRLASDVVALDIIK